MRGSTIPPLLPAEQSPARGPDPRNIGHFRSKIWRTWSTKRLRRFDRRCLAVVSHRRRRRDHPSIIIAKTFPRKLVLWLGRRQRTRCPKQRGSGSATFMRRSPSKLVLPWHEPLPLSKSACVGGWRLGSCSCCRTRRFAAPSQHKTRAAVISTVWGDPCITRPDRRHWLRPHTSPCRRRPNRSSRFHRTPQRRRR